MYLFWRKYFHPRIWLIAWALIAGVGLLLVSLESPVYYFTYGDDDQLMVNMAHGFIMGHWSSTWAVTGIATMAKPVGYPLYLAGAHYLPWAPTISVYLLYIVGSLLIAFSWRRISHSSPQSTLILLILVLNPIAFTWTSMRIYRDFYMTAISTFATGLSFLAASEVSKRLRLIGVDRNPGPPLERPSPLARSARAFGWYVVIFGVGLSVGVAAITKPTWIILLPAIVAPLVFPGLNLFRKANRSARRIIALGLAAALLVGTAWGVISITKYMNQRRYGVALTEDFDQGSVARAWKLWASVEAGPRRQYVPVTKEMRLAVYKVSPAAAELRQNLESRKNLWKGVDCESVLRICDESGPWFDWDMISAAQATGRVNSVRQLEDFYQAVSDQIQSACDHKRLRCSSSPVLAPGLPPLDQISAAGVLRGTVSGLWQMIGNTLPMGRPFGPVADPVTYQLWTSVVPAMPPLSTAAKGDTPAGVYVLLRIMNQLYRILDIGMGVLIVVGFGRWGWTRLRRRHSRESGFEHQALTISVLCVVSSVLGMATLATFAAAQFPGFITPSYWSDFASADQLALVFGLFAVLPVLRHWHRSHAGGGPHLAKQRHGDGRSDGKPSAVAS